MLRTENEGSKPVEYVVLVYASAPAQERPGPLVVVARGLVASDARRLILNVTAAPLNWHQQSPP
jgi:hypothetical protein